MKTRSVIAALIAAIMLLACVSCGGGKPEVTTPAPTTTAGTPDATTAPDQEATTAEEVVTTAEEVVTTEEVTTEGEPVIQYGLNGYGTLEGADRQALLDLMPALLPDNTPIEEFYRPYCADDTFDADGYPDNFNIAGNSGPNTKLVGTDGGALYGLAFRLPAYGQNLEKRAEITASFYNMDDNIENNVKGAKGILFWVDYSHVDAKEDAQLCASVTINNNDVRANIADHGSLGYYFKDGAWNETHNVNACRMEVPAGFAGWIYIPAASFVYSSDKSTAADENGRFQDIDVQSMRCYTDGYVYTDAEDKYVIFDEIIYIY